ncbi:MAG: hypothetical protein KF914_02875 [Rhizobiaceae bacterium]|nr:hypothetical protein [Rhizobiaceae bacterium]
MLIYKSVSIGAYTYLRSGIVKHVKSIGRYCSLGPNVVLGEGEHPMDWLSTSMVSYMPSMYSWYPPEVEAAPKRLRPRNPETDVSTGHGQVVIGNDVWIGTNAMIRRGVTIGDGAVIGAGAYVNRDVEPYSVVAGVPARVIRKRFDDATIERLIALKWWEFHANDLIGVPFESPGDAITMIEDREAAGTLERWPVTYRTARLTRQGYTRISGVPRPASRTVPAAAPAAPVAPAVLPAEVAEAPRIDDAGSADGRLDTAPSVSAALAAAAAIVSAEPDAPDAGVTETVDRAAEPEVVAGAATVDYDTRLQSAIDEAFASVVEAGEPVPTVDAVESAPVDPVAANGDARSVDVGTVASPGRHEAGFSEDGLDPIFAAALERIVSEQAASAATAPQEPGPADRASMPDGHAAASDRAGPALADEHEVAAVPESAAATEDLTQPLIEHAEEPEPSVTIGASAAIDANRPEPAAEEPPAEPESPQAADGTASGEHQSAPSGAPAPTTPDLPMAEPASAGRPSAQDEIAEALIAALASRELEAALSSYTSEPAVSVPALGSDSPAPPPVGRRLGDWSLGLSAGDQPRTPESAVAAARDAAPLPAAEPTDAAAGRSGGEPSDHLPASDSEPMMEAVLTALTFEGLQAALAEPVEAAGAADAKPPASEPAERPRPLADTSDPALMALAFDAPEPRTGRQGGTQRAPREKPDRRRFVFPWNK